MNANTMRSMRSVKVMTMNYFISPEPHSTLLDTSVAATTKSHGETMRRKDTPDSGASPFADFRNMFPSAGSTRKYGAISFRHSTQLEI